MKVYIGVGHGGTDPGACSQSFKESSLTLAIALSCQAELARNLVETLISRTTDITFPTNKKVPQANTFNADLVVDIHINAGGGHGVEVYYSIAGGKSKTLAYNVLTAIVSTTKQTNRGIKTKQGNSGDYFGIIRDTDAPAVLVECGFIDTDDINNFNTAEKQAIMGKAIARGIMDTLCIIPRPERVEPVNNTTYRVSFGGISTHGEAETIQNIIQNMGYNGKIEEEK